VKFKRDVAKTCGLTVLVLILSVVETDCDEQKG